jgi:hypothetical protein
MTGEATVKIHLVRISVASIALLSASAARAQYQDYSTPGRSGFHLGQTLVAINYEPSVPIGSFEDYISDWSWRGFSFEGRKKFHPKLSAGLSFSWNRWDQTYSDVSVNLPNGVVSGPVYRYADMFAIRATAHYYLLEGPIQPYAGFGIGGAWAYSFQQVADIADSQNGFHFIVSPEAGVLVQLVPGSTAIGLNLAVRYTYTTAEVGRNEDEISTISTIAGLTWAY